MRPARRWPVRYAGVNGVFLIAALAVYTEGPRPARAQAIDFARIAIRTEISARTFMGSTALPMPIPIIPTRFVRAIYAEEKRHQTTFLRDQDGRRPLYQRMEKTGNPKYEINPNSTSR